MLTSLLLFALAATVTSHTVIVYPGWRGNNLHTNGTMPDGFSVPEGSRGINWNETAESYTFPYGMQWMYPCGGMPTSTNRTKWPVTGGAVTIQPGWFSGHQFAFFYINLGLGKEPRNMSLNMVPVFQIVGPSNRNYSSTFCLPQVPLPTNVTVKPGDLATIQVIETAQHGAALYSCVDIEFAEPQDVPQVNRSNCWNSTEPDVKIGFNLVFATKSLNSAAPALLTDLISVILPLFVALALLW